MTPKMVISIVSIALTAAKSAFALTGNELHEWCATPTDKLLCVTYVMGVLEGENMGVVIRTGNAKDFKRYSMVCAPEGVTNGQLADIVAKWLKDNPEKRNGAASSIVLIASAKAFPCR